jgi:hypothetical protein
MSTVSPRAVVVMRPTEFELVVARHGTREQASFFLRQSGRTLDELDARHQKRQRALEAVSAAVPLRWRRARIDRADLSRFLFGPEDVVVVVGQDGLVANVAKYLRGQPVVGVNPDPSRNDGVLAPHPAEATSDLLAAVARGRAKVEERTMVEARLDDGQRLLALNEVFVGHRTHQSARYRITHGATEEAHSSSGVIVATGTGATGWARSITRQRAAPPALPSPEARALVFLVREPFPSVATGTSLEAGTIAEGGTLSLRSEMDDAGSLFGDGIEDDRIPFGWGQRVELGVAPERLRLVRA